jgi:hypothetical protein
VSGRPGRSISQSQTDGLKGPLLDPPIEWPRPFRFDKQSHSVSIFNNAMPFISSKPTGTLSTCSSC